MTRAMKRKETFIQIISILLITLWIYTAINKLMELDIFKSQLSRQAVIGPFAVVMVWLLPAIELTAAVILFFQSTRKAGMLLSFSLMAIFTAYVALAVVGYWENIPCSCGGVLNELGWKDHLWFNLFFLTISGIGLFLSRNTYHRGSLKQAAPAGEPA